MAKKAYRFVNAPPANKMRRQSPDSAPRLYEWLVDNGYVEPVQTARSKRGRARKNSRSRGRARSRR